MHTASHPARLLMIVGAGLVAALGATLVWPTLTGHGSRADASCAAPQAFAPKGVKIRPGEELTIKGRFFLADCYDTGQQGTPPPMRHVVLRIRQHGHTWRLGVADARPDPLGTISWRVHIPRGVRPGAAVLVTGDFRSDVRVYAAPHHPPAHLTTPTGLPDTGE
jgi:hypothetical protein